MTFVANVLRVMIASPSDVPEARDAVEKSVNDWNNSRAENNKIVLLPWRWETSSVPVLGAHPQALINSQAVDKADIVFALFGSRLGAPTPEAVSGTVEEIERSVVAGKPVHLYFSKASLPNDVDTKQLDGLREFKNQISERGLYGEFETPQELGFQVWQAIEHDLVQMNLGTPILTTDQSPIEFLVQPMQAREQNGVSTKGVPKYRTRHWLEVTNVGSEDAMEVTYEAVGEQSSMVVLDQGAPTVIHKNQVRRIPIEFVMAGSDPSILKIRWVENGEAMERDFHVD